MRYRHLPRNREVLVEPVRPNVRGRHSASSDQPDAWFPSLALARRRGLRDPKGREATINGETHYLWRAVEHEGEVLESYVAKKRDESAAIRFFKKTLKRHGQVEMIITDGLRSCPSVMKELGNIDRREMRRWLNNRAEMLIFRSADESGRCSDLGGWNRYRSSPWFTPLCTTISTRNATPSPWPSGKIPLSEAWPTQRSAK